MAKLDPETAARVAAYDAELAELAWLDEMERERRERRAFYSRRVYTVRECRTRFLRRRYYVVDDACGWTSRRRRDEEDVYQLRENLELMNNLLLQ